MIFLDGLNLGNPCSGQLPLLFVIVKGKLPEREQVRRFGTELGVDSTLSAIPPRCLSLLGSRRI
jgi:hypothetical protein